MTRPAPLTTTSSPQRLAAHGSKGFGCVFACVFMWEYVVVPLPSLPLAPPLSLLHTRNGSRPLCTCSATRFGARRGLAKEDARGPEGQGHQSTHIPLIQHSSKASSSGGSSSSSSRKTDCQVISLMSVCMKILLSIKERECVCERECVSVSVSVCVCVCV